jgi:hypothetical protein
MVCSKLFTNVHLLYTWRLSSKRRSSSKIFTDLTSSSLQSPSGVKKKKKKNLLYSAHIHLMNANTNSAWGYTRIQMYKGRLPCRGSNLDRWVRGHFVTIHSPLYSMLKLVIHSPVITSLTNWSCIQGKRPAQKVIFRQTPTHTILHWWCWMWTPFEAKLRTFHVYIHTPRVQSYAVKAA